MSTFAFRAVDMAGASVAGELDAPSETQVGDQLRERGLIALDISRKREAREFREVFERFRRVGLRDLAVFSRQFATLVGAGMPLLRSLHTLEEQTEDEQLTEAIAALRSDVEAGSSLTAAMERHPKVFDSLFVAMVRAGEGSGRLDEALARIAHQLEKLDALQRQVRSAMLYPSVVFGIALAVMLAIVAFIVPVFVGVYEEIAQDNPGESTDLPLMTQVSVGASDLVTGQWYLLLAGIAVVTIAFLRWKQSTHGRRQWDALKLRTPFRIGDVVQKVALARWSRTFSGAIASGVPILQAIQITGQTSGNAVVAGAMDDVYDNVKRGGSVAKPIEGHAIFPPMVSSMVAIGEESGGLEHMLTKIADFYDAETDAKVKALTSLIEPAMIVFVGAVVGFIVISMYLPIFDLYDKIG